MSNHTIAAPITTWAELRSSDREVLNRSEVAALLALDPRTIDHAIEDGTIPAIHVGRRVRPHPRRRRAARHAPRDPDELGPRGQIACAPSVPEQYLPLGVHGIRVDGHRLTIDVTADGWVMEGLGGARFKLTTSQERRC